MRTAISLFVRLGLGASFLCAAQPPASAPVAAPAPSQDQGPALPPGVCEAEFRIGTDPWALPGTLALPGGTGPFPLVILVHDSGPLDRDGRVAACTPLRDLARGLAARGIAALRYDKRAFVHRARMESLGAFTVREECLEDAALAAAAARALPVIDAKRIFLLGHGLGGYLLPRLARAVPGCAGYIGLASYARPLEDVALEQVKRRGAPSLFMSKIEADIARIKTLGPATPPAEILFSAPAAYWMDLKGYDPAREAAALAKPLLILHGDRDVQTTEADLQLWRAALEGRKHAQIKRYPGLNHLLMPVDAAATGPHSGADYGKPGQMVAPEVIQDLAAWVKAR